jgi:pantetheine-phosphate adenylyltransferase
VLSRSSIVAKLRSEKGLPALKTLIIEVISPNAHKMTSEDPKHLREAKMSSTSIRQWIVQQRTTRAMPTRIPGGWNEDSLEI